MKTSVVGHRVSLHPAQWVSALAVSSHEVIDVPGKIFAGNCARNVSNHPLGQKHMPVGRSMNVSGQN